MKGGGFLRINLTVAGNTNTADDPVPGLLGFPTARNIRFSDVRLNGASSLVDATQIAPEKPLQQVALSNVTGTCAKGMAFAHATGVELGGIAVTGFSGPLLSTTDVTGSRLEDAVALPAAGP